jgi:23S rRNA pseudouridine2605 synthase
MFKYNKQSDIGYVKLIITEGRNHQVKDMFNALGYDVLKLKRERVAFLTVNDLPSGKYRYLTTKEVKKLYSIK